RGWRTNKDSPARTKAAPKALSRVRPIGTTGRAPSATRAWMRSSVFMEHRIQGTRQQLKAPMQCYPNRTLAHLHARCDFLCGMTLERDGTHHFALSWIQLCQRPFQVMRLFLADCLLNPERFHHTLDRDLHAATAPPQSIHDLVARDRRDPWADRRAP